MFAFHGASARTSWPRLWSVCLERVHVPYSLPAADAGAVTTLDRLGGLRLRISQAASEPVEMA